MNDADNELLNIFKEAVSIEIYGQEYYSRFSDLVEDENARSLLKGLSRDESEHRELIQVEYNKISGKPLNIKMLDHESKEKAKIIFPESTLSMNETKEVLKLGIRTEDRSIDLYSRSATKTENISSKNLFLKLERIEKGHRELLEDALYYLSQEGTWYGYSPPTLEG